jgi:hypothetical protein
VYCLVDGEGFAFVIGDEVGFLEKGSSDGILRFVCSLLKRKIVCCRICISIIGTRNRGKRQLQVESFVRKCDVDIIP